MYDRQFLVFAIWPYSIFVIAMFYHIVPDHINSLWSSDAIWPHRVGSILACCGVPYKTGDESHNNSMWYGAFPILHTNEKIDQRSDLTVNTLRLRQNGRHFADDIFKCIFLHENVWIPIKISLKFVPKGPINNIPALVQIMAWRRPGDKPFSEPMIVSLPTHICVTWPHWVNRCLTDALTVN